MFYCFVLKYANMYLNTSKQKFIFCVSFKDASKYPTEGNARAVRDNLKDLGYECDIYMVEIGETKVE